jgi:hypothetical protein
VIVSRWASLAAGFVLERYFLTVRAESVLLFHFKQETKLLNDGTLKDTHLEKHHEMLLMP